MNIYFTNALVSHFELNAPLSIEWQEFLWLAEKSLKGKQKLQLKRLRTLVDIENARALLQNGELNPLGNWTKADTLNENFIGQLPPPLAEILNQEGRSSSLPVSFSTLYAELFHWDAQSFGQGNFVGRYFALEITARWTLAQLRAVDQKLSLSQEQGALEEKGLWEFINRCFDLVERDHLSQLSALRDLYYRNKDRPLELSQAVSSWRLEAIEVLIEGDLFGQDRLLANLAQLMICTDWKGLNRETGLMALRQMRTLDAQR